MGEPENISYYRELLNKCRQMNRPPHIAAKWDDLSVDLKLKVIGYMDFETRDSLRQCSRLDNLLAILEPTDVDRAKIRITRKADIQFFVDHVVGDLESFVDDPELSIFQNLNFDLMLSADLDEFNTKLQTVGAIRELKIVNPIGIDQSLFQKNMKIKHVMLYFDLVTLSDIENTLNNIDGGELKSVQFVYLRRSENFSMCFDLPKIVNAQTLHIFQSSMTRSQLFNLKATDLVMDESDKISEKDVNDYMKTRLTMLDEHDIHFQFMFNWPNYIKILKGLTIADRTIQGELWINSPSSTRYQLHLRFFEPSRKEGRVALEGQRVELIDLPSDI